MNIDTSIYANDAYAQALLQGARAVAAENVVDPIAFDENYKELEPAIYSGETIIITGPPQNGKSTAVLLMSAKLGIPCLTFSCDEGIQKSALFGHMEIGPNGQTVWVDGPLVRSWRDGYIFNAEEILQLVSEKTSWFMKMIDGSKFLMGHNGEIIPRHPNFRFIATGNPLCRGNKPSNEAFSRRFGVAIDVAELSAKGFLLLGKSKRPWVSDGFFNASYNLTQAVLNEAKRFGKLNESCGITQLCSLFGLIENDPTPLTYDVFVRKVRNTFINVLTKARISQEDRDLFQTANATQAILQKMYKEYAASPRPTSVTGGGVPAPDPATQSAASSQTMSAGTQMLNKLRRIK